MREITTAIEIDAPREAVWNALTDFESYPEWNDRTRIEGVAKAGERLAVSAGPEGGRLPTFRPEVLVADGRELRWRGRLYVPGLFDGEHHFLLTDLGGGRTRLTQSERFTGLLVGVVLGRYGALTEANFEATNAALKERVEAAATDGTDEAPAATA